MDKIKSRRTEIGVSRSVRKGKNARKVSDFFFIYKMKRSRGEDGAPSSIGNKHLKYSSGLERRPIRKTGEK